MRDSLVCEAYARTIIAPAYAHYKEKVLGERRSQIERLRVAHFFDLPFVKNALKFLEHGDFRNEPPGTRQVPRGGRDYPAAASPPRQKGDDSFSTLKWWRTEVAELNQRRCWCHALRGVLAHAPPSTAVKRVFSILNGVFDDDQLALLTGYIEPSLQLQFNL